MSLHFGRTSVDYLAILLTLAGIGGLRPAGRAGPAIAMPEPKRPRRRTTARAAVGGPPPEAPPGWGGYVPVPRGLPPPPPGSPLALQVPPGRPAATAGVLTAGVPAPDPQ